MKIPKTTKITKCRLCKNKKLKQIYNFGNHFVSNFVNKASIKKGVKAPLNLVYCNNCELLQLEHSAPQEIMYKKFYWYKSGITKTTLITPAANLAQLEPRIVLAEVLKDRLAIFAATAVMVLSAKRNAHVIFFTRSV